MGHFRETENKGVTTLSFGNVRKPLHTFTEIGSINFPCAVNRKLDTVIRMGA